MENSWPWGSFKFKFWLISSSQKLQGTTRRNQRAGVLDFSTSTIRPFHCVWSRALIASSASSSFSSDKNPNPRESPVSLSLTIRTSVTRPNLENFFSKSLSVVTKLKPAMNKLFPGLPRPVLRLGGGDHGLRLGECRRDRYSIGDVLRLGEYLALGDLW